MPTYQVTDPQSGRVLRLTGDTPPTDADLDEIFAQYRQEPSALSLEAPGTEIQGQAPAAPDRSLEERITGGAEAALALGTGMTTGLAGAGLGTIRGMGESVLSGQYGTQQGADLVERRAQQGMESLTYAPRSEAGQQYTQSAGEALAPLATLPVVMPGAGVAASLARPSAQVSAAEAVNLGRRAGDAARQTGTAIAQSGPGRFVGGIWEAATPNNVQAAAPLSVGSAEVDAATRRAAVSQSLPVPIDMTLGEATRNRQLLAFEREEAKGEFGDPLTAKIDRNIKQFHENFDVLIDRTGAATVHAGNEAVGRQLLEVLGSGYSKAKEETRQAYKTARQSEEAKINVDPSAPITIAQGTEFETTGSLIDYLNNEPTGINKLTDAAKKYAEILKIARKDEDGNLQPLNPTAGQLRDLRVKINEAVGYEKPDIRHATILKKMIDSYVEPVAGPLYKRADNLRIKQGRKYENRAAIADLLNNKRGTDDRKIAIEDIVRKSLISGSTEDAGALRATTLTSGNGGRQAWKEMQGAFLKYIQDASTTSAVRSGEGLDSFSAHKYHNVVRALDQSGKLEMVLGRKNAQVIRDIDDIIRDITTNPPGTLVNTSGTAGMLKQAMGAAGEMVITGNAVGIPLPVITALRKYRQYTTDKEIRKKIDRSINWMQQGAQQ